MKFIKHLFTIILVTTLCTLSFITIKNYDTLEEKQYDYDRFVRNNIHDIQLFLFDIIEKNDSTYQFIQIDDTDEKPNEIPYIQNELESEIRNFTNFIENDPNFLYVIRKNGRYISNEFDLNANRIDPKYHKFYSYIEFNENGDISKCHGDICPFFQDYDFENYIITNYLHENDQYDDEAYYDYGYNYYIAKDKITFNNPKNVDFYILMPHKIVPTGYTYHELTDQVEIYLIFGCIFTLLALAILSFIIFLTPIEKLNKVNPYKTIKNWLFECNLFFFTSIVLFLGFLVLVLSKYTLDGTIEYLLDKSYNHSFFMMVNFIAWALFYYSLTIIPFLMKYIFTYGFFRYLRDYTLIGRSLIKVKNEISNIQIGYKVVLLTILAFTIPVLLAIGAIYLFAEFGLILTAIGYIGIFIFTLMLENKIYRQYKILLEKTNQLSEGNFDIEINEDLGLFEDYKKELLQVKDGFEKAVEEEVKSSNMKTELITNVSHDLKTPITCIKNYVTLLEDESLDKEKQKEYINNLHQYTNRLTHLVEDLFEVSKVNSGNVSLELVELNIVDLVKQVLAENEDIFTQSNLNVVTKFENDHITCELDSDKTYRIFENLITNIGKYALPYTRVYVDIIQLDNHVQITFKNISKDEMNFTSEEIVERFVRGDKSRHEQGSGIGLAIVKSYTEIQNGTFNISVDGDLFKAILTFDC